MILKKLLKKVYVVFFPIAFEMQIEKAYMCFEGIGTLYFEENYLILAIKSISRLYLLLLSSRKQVNLHIICFIFPLKLLKQIECKMRIWKQSCFFSPFFLKNFVYLLGIQDINHEQEN
jgi:hypothetical protein